MVANFSVPLSGLAAAAKRLQVSAENVANLRSVGYAPDRSQREQEGYQARRVQQVSTANGGVKATPIPISPASVLSYEPSDPDADAEGLIARPNVSLEEELVEQLLAEKAYKANLKVIEAQDEMLGRVLDIES